MLHSLFQKFHHTAYTNSIAHRLSTIVDADKIIFIEKGKMTGMGTHHELTQSHALYREFAEQQFT